MTKNIYAYYFNPIRLEIPTEFRLRCIEINKLLKSVNKDNTENFYVKKEIPSSFVIKGRRVNMDLHFKITKESIDLMVDSQYGILPYRLVENVDMSTEERFFPETFILSGRKTYPYDKTPVKIQNSLHPLDVDEYNKHLVAEEL